MPNLLCRSRLHPHDTPDPWEVFLSEMEVVVPWPALLYRIEPHYPKSGRRGRQPMPMASMLRIYCMQNWFNLSDQQMEDALYGIESNGY